MRASDFVEEHVMLAMHELATFLHFANVQG